MSWWTELGYYPFEEGKGGFPRTGQVIKYYREKKTDDEGHLWTQKRLAEVLDLTEKTIGEMENRDAVLDFDRRQCLCQLFAIPAILLGIRAREDIIRMVEEHRAKHVVPVVEPSSPSSAVWWVELGYHAFEPGRHGLFPRTGQVIKHYRALKLDQKGRAWTQRLLAQTLGLTDQAVWDLENRDIGMDFDRRQFLSDLFAIPPVLLGIVTVEEICKIVEEKRAVQPAPPVVSTESRVSHKLLIDIEEYTALLEDSWTTFISDPARLSMANVYLSMDALYRELPHVRDKKPIYELLCRYHDFVANVLRDQEKYHEAIEHCHKGLRLAKRLNKDEILALILYEWGYTLWETDRFDEAVQKYQEARRYEQRLPSNLKGCLLLDTACASGEVARTPDAKREVIALMDHAGTIVRSNWKGADPYFLNLNLDRYYLARSTSLLAIGRNRDALSELKLVKVGLEHPRRQVYNDLLQAQARLNLGDYDGVVDLAESGLIVAQQINSEVLIARAQNLSRQLKESPYKDSSDVARLEYLLRKR
jgi:transcriptional regulator with XRE-family HTH domain